jgi:hypothetical protein
VVRIRTGEEDETASSNAHRFDAGLWRHCLPRPRNVGVPAAA